ncbi:4Fe-4S ferredoxin N-terminal domain-containing protein [Salinilacihabitans rarus]|uniref:4Fe-4S ferredoxin N-terminal domain-containing protein n=1 Tax=Salinilacihabitans rarus TaxID=2961596 RepID=UPI003CCD836C
MFEDDVEERAEAILGDVPFDTELGKRLAKDARRVANGELSREKFHEKHHEAVVREFGRDERNSKPEGFDDE